MARILRLLEVGRDEDVGRQAGGGGVGGDRVGEVAGGGTGDGLEAELHCTRQRDRDDAVLERVRRVRRLVLDPHLAQAEALREPVGLHQRREAGRQRRRSACPPAGGSRRSARGSAAPPGCGGAARRAWTWAASRRLRAGRSTGRTRSGPRGRSGSCTPCTAGHLPACLVLILPPGSAAVESSHAGRNPRRISQAVVWSLLELPPSSDDRSRRRGWRGFIGPVPPPLWMRAARVSSRVAESQGSRDPAQCQSTRNSMP